MRWEKERKEEAEAFSEAQKKRRLKSKTARAAAGKSRAALLTTRAEEAIAMREEKKKLAEFHRQRLQEQYQLRAETVKGACMHPPWTAARRLHHQAARSLLAADRLPPPPLAPCRACPAGVIGNSYLQPENQTGDAPLSPGGTPLSSSFYSLTNIRPQSPERATAE